MGNIPRRAAKCPLNITGEDQYMTSRRPILRLSTTVVAAAVLCGLALVPSQAAEQQNVATLKPADVVYTFNKVRPGGIVRDVTGPSHRRLQLDGNWRRAIGANGKQDAVAFRARSWGVINNSEGLAPRRRAFAVAMTVKVNNFVGSDTPNLAQQGFYRDRSQWKVEVIPGSGRVRFRVSGVSGDTILTSRRGINDGQFHTVVCYRIHKRIGIVLDGRERTRRSSAGAIRSSRKVTLANKHLRTSEDQFRGVFDYFALALGRRPVARALAKAPDIP